MLRILIARLPLVLVHVNDDDEAVCMPARNLDEAFGRFSRDP